MVVERFTRKKNNSIDYRSRVSYIEPYHRSRNNYSEGDSIEKGVDWGTSLSVGCGESPFIFTALLHNANYIIL